MSICFLLKIKINTKLTNNISILYLINENKGRRKKLKSDEKKKKKEKQRKNEVSKKKKRSDVTGKTGRLLCKYLIQLSIFYIHIHFILLLMDGLITTHTR
jgi:hypothetical protein